MTLSQKEIKLAAILFLIGTSVFSQNFQWANKLGGTGNDKINSITVDASGNLYVIGTYNGIVDFDLGPGVANLSSPAGTAMFFAKYDLNGNYVWAKSIGRSSFVDGLKIATDAIGNVYIAGKIFGGSIQFGPQPSSILWPSGTDIFIAKYDGEGNFKSTVLIGGYQESAHLHDMKIDKQDNIYITGYYNGNVNFRHFEGGIYTAIGGTNDAFLAKYSSQGNCSWVKSMGGSSDDYGNEIAIDNSGNVYLVGYYNISGDFDPGATTVTLISNGGTEGFIEKFDPQGNIVWANSIGSTGGDQINNILIDNDNNILISGMYQNTVDFDFSGTVNSLISAGGTDIFIAKYTSNATLLWTKSIGGLNQDIYPHLEIDKKNNIYLSGLFMSTTDFDPSVTVNSLTSLSGTIYDIFLASYTSSGNYISAKGIYGTATTKSLEDMFTDENGNTFLAGYFSGSADFNMDAPVYNLTSTTTDGFIAKYLTHGNMVIGNVYSDDNNNGVKDLNEKDLENIIVQVQPTQLNFKTNGNGNYVAFADTGTFIIKSLPLQYYSANPTSQLLSFNSYGLMDTIDFALYPTPDIKDLKVTITNFSRARAGRMTRYRITYSNIGTDTLNGTINFTANNALAFSSSVPTVDYTIGGVVYWNYSNLYPTEERNIDIDMMVSISVKGGDTLTSFIAGTPLVMDIKPSDNMDTLCHIVMASYDPNDKQVLPAGNITSADVANEKELTYTIRFQNTGNDTAFTVIIRDTISSFLNISQLDIISTSHQCQLSFKKNAVAEFIFNNIMLPDSNANEIASHGFVKYRIKCLTTPALGDSILNAAYIYFDYNDPIITNSTATKVANPLITLVDAAPLLSSDFRVFPNPSKGSFQIVGKKMNENITLNIYNGIGELIYSKVLNDINKEIDISNQANGIYLIQVISSENISNAKIILRQ